MNQYGSSFCSVDELSHSCYWKEIKLIVFNPSFLEIQSIVTKLSSSQKKDCWWIKIKRKRLKLDAASLRPTTLLHRRHSPSALEERHPAQMLKAYPAFRLPVWTPREQLNESLLSLISKK